MALGKLWVIGCRDLVRNPRRSGLTLLAVALGLALLITMNGLVAGTMEGSLQSSIRLRTGHMQIRAKSYEEEKMSVLWADLLSNADKYAAQARRLNQVKAAAPVLWISGLLTSEEEAIGLRIGGIEPDSALYDPIREGLVAGRFLKADDRNGVVISQRLADSVGATVGDKVNLVVSMAEGSLDEATFIVRGLYVTEIPSFDDATVYMPLSKAQAFTGASGRASAIVIMLHRQDDAATVAAALQSPGVAVLTWQALNATLLETVQSAMAIYALLDGIVMLVVAVLIVNTLLMAVFERTREIGILAALGMKRRQIMLMFLLEAAILGLAGIVVGTALGSLGVAYLSTTGIYLGDMATTAGNMGVGSTMYARFMPANVFSLSLWTLVVILIASLYPARFAARLEPVAALHAS